ncbi:MAG: molybdate ABC transporter permease subunit [Thermoanaerobaculia bacterium]|nr:molybdate ABC transporter permease subunit [Thermoanaerobaculia bacterium]
MNDGALVALGLSAQVALCATLAILPPGIALGWLLARREVPGRALLETLTALPLVLPPTAIGYLLLRLLARDGPLGERTLGFDPDLLFTWKGAVLASAIMALPLVVRTARLAFEEVDPRLESMARTLGLGPLRAFAEVTLPLARRGLAAAAVLGFTRALGEFGATVIVAGNIPGETQTLALAIFSDMQVGRDSEAMTLVAITVVLAFAALWTVEVLLHRRRPR